MDPDAEAAAMAEWRDRPGVFRRRSAKPARAAIRSGMVRRTGEVALCRSDLRHAAICAETGPPAAPAGHHHAQAVAAAEAPALRPALLCDAVADALQPRLPVAGVSRNRGRALCRH